VIALAVFAGAASALEIPARQSLMIELVGRDDLRDAIALNSSGFNLARILGPGVAAAVIAHLGIAWCFGLNALSFLTVLMSLRWIRLPPWMPPIHVASPARGMIEGLRFMRSTPSVAALIEMVTVYSILGIPYITLMPVVARDLLRLGASGYGILLSCVGIGGLTGALTLAAVGSRVRRGRILRIASYAYATLLILFSFVRMPQLAYPLLLLTGFSMIVTNAVANGLLQSLTPDHFRGRVMSVYSLIVVGLAQVIGAFLAGAVARAVGVDWAIGAGAAIMLVYALYAFPRHREWLDAQG
jgi:predicted MFS family arabinose efflux permease